MRLRSAVDFQRAAKVEAVAEECQHDDAPQVDVKGAHILERSHQAEGDGMRGDHIDRDRWYRMGFTRNDERGKDE